MKLTVIGNGVSGSSVARAARNRGHAVRVLAADVPMASRASLAVLRVSYLSGVPDAREAVNIAAARYEEAGCEIVRGAKVLSPGKTVPKDDPDWIAVDPRLWLVDAERAAVLPDWLDPDSDATIHCTGTGLPDVTMTWGTTWYNAYAGALTFEGLRVNRWAPYRTDDAVAYKRGGARLGSSSAKSPQAARGQALAQFGRAMELGWLATDEGWVILPGVRAQRDREWDRAGRLWRFGGFHRSGWSLAPTRADDLLDRIEAS